MFLDRITLVVWDANCCGFIDHDGSSGGIARHGGSSSRDRGGGRFVNFQCQINVKFGQTMNMYHFQSKFLIDPST